MFGHNVGGPLKMLKEEFLCTGPSEKTNVLDFVTGIRERLCYSNSQSRGGRYGKNIISHFFF